jgi:hypothetical protein
VRIPLTVQHEPADDTGAPAATLAVADKLAACPATPDRGAAGVTYDPGVDDRSAAERPPRMTSARCVETPRALR